MSLVHQIPYWRLAAFYFVYFAALGSFLPYWGLYLESVDFSAYQIGVLMAVLAGTKVVAPNLWGWIADRSGKTNSIIRIASFSAVIAFSGVLVETSYAWLIAVTLVFSFFWNAALPQFEVLTLNFLEDDPHRYSRVRIWGSIGFIVAVMTIGVVLDYRDITVLPWIITILFFAIWISSLSVPDHPSTKATIESFNILHIVVKPEVLSFLVVVCLAQAAHGPYYVFYSIYLQNHGYSGYETGLLWSLGVFAEVVLFFYMHRILQVFSLKHILMFSVMMGSLRWILLGCCVDNPTLLVFAQLLHAATFGSTHVAAIHFVHRYFYGTRKGRGQALYSSMSFGLGGMIGSYTSGELWGRYSAASVYYSSALLCFCAFLIAWRWLKNDFYSETESLATKIIEEEL